MKPIGIFDSGIGGLSVYLSCKKLLPEENYIYIDDGAYAPYGDKTEEYVISRAVENTKTLISCGAKAVIVACNTATAAAISELRSRFDCLIIGTEPAIAPALKSTSGKLLVLATPLTCSCLMRRYDCDRLVFSPQPTLAADIENAAGEKELAGLAKKATEGEYEAVVLGCTHYSYLTPYIDKKVFDGAQGVSRRLKSLLEANHLLGV